MKNTSKKIGVLVGALMLGLSANFLNAQKISQQSSNIKIDGTSTLHKWDMTSTQSTFTGDVNGNKIEDVKFVMKATSLKSKDSSLDKNAYKALNTTKYPDIVFTAASLPTSGTATIQGNMTISNVTKNISIPVSVTKNGNSYVIKGSTKMKMTTFGIKPPSVMMGTIKSGDEININFNITTK
ncbi:YceI family protein [Chryseobacterium sp. POL2]|uniref:YceI family protein n=1 Tax=Chryseobacterium sp. POL2 TaxID=2713414 RepID=UPI0013E1F92B|nr:YceI family protein [Chryseobacterium sp. POL2]QIG88824.1 YceI family protein [Chryseobacterium sp. POL2]